MLLCAKKFQIELLSPVLICTDADSNVDGSPLSFATTLNSYSELVSRPATVVDKLLLSVVDLQTLSPTLRYCMIYVSIPVSMASFRGVIDTFTLEALSNTIVGGRSVPRLTT